MKKLLIATSAIVFASGMAMADGLTMLGLDDPEVMAPPSVTGDWSGPYIGLSYGRTEKTTESYREWLETEEGYDYHEATCTRGTGDNQHENNKCKLNKDLFDALDVNKVTNPWNVTHYKLNDGTLSDQLAKYDADYYGLWLGDDVDGVHTWTLGEVVPTQEQVATLNNDNSRDAVLSVAHHYKADVITKMSERVTSVEEMDEFGAFVGYRKDWGQLVGGVELGVNGDVASLEAQAGLDLGLVLVYGFGGLASFDSTDGSVYGAGTDLKINENIVVGVKYTVGEFDDIDTESTLLRVAYKF